MSRHRNVRNINVQDVFEEEGYQDYDSSDDFAEMTNEEKAQMEVGLREVKAIIGDNTGITDKEIEDSLWYYYFDSQKTINWLLDQSYKNQLKEIKTSSVKKTKLQDPVIPPTKKARRFNSKKNDSCQQRDNFSLGSVTFCHSTNTSPNLNLNRNRTAQSEIKPFKQYSPTFVTSADIWSWYNIKWTSRCEDFIFPLKNLNPNSPASVYRRGGLLGGADSNKSQASLSELSFKRRLSPNQNESSKVGEFESLDSSQPIDTSFSVMDNRGQRPPSFSNNYQNQEPQSLASLASLSARQSTRPTLGSLGTRASNSNDFYNFSKSSSSLNPNNILDKGPSLSLLAQKSLSQSSGRVALTSLGASNHSLKNSQLSATQPIRSEGSRTDSSKNSEIFSSTSSSSSFLRPQIAQTSISKSFSTVSLPRDQIGSQLTHPSFVNLQTISPQQPNISPDTKVIENKTSLSSLIPVNPFIASPSIFAIAIFAKFEDISPVIIDHFSFDIFSSGGNKNAFSFEEPSPDDLILKAQSQKTSSKGKNRQIVSTPLSTKTFQSIPLSSSSKTPQATRPSLSSPKSKFLGTETFGGFNDESIVEILDDEQEEQLRFDISALNLDSPAKTLRETTFSPLTGLNKNNPTSSSSTLKNSPKISQVKPPPKLSKRIDVLAEYKKRSLDKESMNLVVIGHVDAGKSTLMGHLLYLLGEVNEKTIKKYERDSQKIGKSSFAYAWVLDETGEERNRGITMDIAITNFETEHRRFTLLDAPGHRDFIPNMISGAAQADVAILVVDATTGEFEAGFEANGQTKEHALLVRSLGVQQLVVAINKLDVVKWSKERFQEIETKLNGFLTQVGFKRDKVAFIPCSGMTGENLLIRSTTNLTWYTGPTMIQQIDVFEPPPRLLERPFRLAITDFFKGGIGNSGGVSVAGRIEAGTIQIGEQMMVVPGGEYGIVKAIEVSDESAKWAAAGDYTLMTLTGLDIMQLSTGAILCSPFHPVPVTSHFLAQIVVFDVKVPITRGLPVILHHQSLDEPASVIKLVAVMDKSTGEIIKKNPRHLSKSTTATVEIKLTNRPIPLETFKENKESGRVTLRRGGDTVAAGVVIDILSYGS